MTLVKTVELDEFGVHEEILVCETNAKGKYVWKPTPEEYEAYRAKEEELAATEALLQYVTSPPRHRRVVESGIPATDYYVRQSRGRTQVRPFGSDGRYLRTSVVDGGVPCTREQLYFHSDHCKPIEVQHLYNELTFRHALSAMGGQDVCGPMTGRKEMNELSDNDCGNPTGMPLASTGT